MTISFDVSPQKGKYPLVVEASNIVQSASPGFSPWSVVTQTSIGFLAEVIGVASAGFLGARPLDIKWDFGDGTTSNDYQPKKHSYGTPGSYSYTGIEYDVNNNIIASYTILIKVLDEILDTFGIGGNTEGRRGLTYGTDNEQGFGWSDNADAGNLWPDTKASILHIFDQNSDSAEVVYDSSTGLPYVDNPRKSYEGSAILDAWKDKIDPLLADSGISIRTRVKLQEFIGSHESFEQKMSDISLYFAPIYKENQGKVGYNNDGLLASMITDIELYKNDTLDQSASAKNIPMKTELYFDRVVVGNILQLAFETTESEYRFTRAECFLTNYDKMRSPFQTPMSEKGYQDSLSNVTSLWISRGDNIINRIGGKVIEGLTASSSIGPDGNSGSAFTSSETVALPNAVISRAMLVTCNTDDPSAVFGNKVVLYAGPVGDGWYAYYLNSDDVIAYLETVPGVIYFDLRVLSNITTEELREYYINDIVQNSGNSTCPRF